LRILLVGAGAAYSTRDVETGYLHALRAAGADVHLYDLGARLSLSRQWLHKLWRAKGRVENERPSWPETIYRGSIEALEMALRFQVDWVLVVSGMYFHPDALILMRRAGLRTAVLFTESPYEDVKQACVAGLVDRCWTNERTSVPVLAQANPQVRYLRHAYDPKRHQPGLGLDVDVPAHDVVFVGTGFRERIETLMSVNWKGIDLGLYGEWGLLGPTSKLRQYVRGGPVGNQTTAALYRRARIGLNLHRSSVTFGRTVPRIDGAESLNPRAYELAACGVFSISDYRAELPETFGDSVPTFTLGELEDVLRAYLVDSPARRKRARQARGDVEPHTFAARAAQLVSDLEGSSNGWQSSPGLCLTSPRGDSSVSRAG
jgi:spore maturation protein CgeB